MKRINIFNAIKIFLIVTVSLLLAIPAQAANQPTPSPWSNPLLIILASFALILVFVIFAMGALLNLVLKLKYGANKTGEQQKLLTKLPLLLAFFLLAAPSSSSAAMVVKQSSIYGGIHPLAFYLFTGLIVIELIIIFTLYYTIRKIAKPMQVKEPHQSVGFLEKLNASVAVENEADILLDHDYDGIKELDNDLPPWWKYGFIVTIIFAVIYLVSYHVTGTGKLQLAEYEQQLDEAKSELKAFKEKSGNQVDETTIIALTSKEDLENGKAIFITNCAPCHGPDGRGIVGPNLTDEYWLHGGSVRDIFKTIKYGWPEKGMKSWDQDLGARKIHELSSYIITLRGTNPPGAKEKQGELYVEALPSDSLQVKSDSAKTNVK